MGIVIKDLRQSYFTFGVMKVSNLIRGMNLFNSSLPSFLKEENSDLEIKRLSIASDIISREAQHLYLNNFIYIQSSPNYTSK